MADETKVQPEAEKAEVAAEEKKPSPSLYKITNVVRRVNTRTRRAVAPGRRRFKQYVCGRRLLRKQSILVTSDEMDTYKDQLMEQVREGAIIIQSPGGSILSVDLLGNLVSREGMAVSSYVGGQTHAEPKRSVDVDKTSKPKDEKLEVEEPPAEEDEVEETLVEEPLTEVATAEENASEVTPDDLTELPGIGPGRAKKLLSSGVVTFKQVAEMSPGDLAKIVGAPLTEDQAADICDAASDLEG